MVFCERCDMILELQKGNIYKCSSCDKIVCKECFNEEINICSICTITDLQKLTKDIEIAYEELADEYDDRIYGPDSTFTPDLKEQVFVETEMEFLFSKVFGQDNVLELGCGTGRITIPMAGKVKSVTATDISSAPLEVAQKKAERASIAHKITFRQGDMVSLPFDSSTFSVVVSTLALMHVPRQHRSKVFSEVSRVLAPNGRLIISVKNKKFEEISTQDLFGRGDTTSVKTNEIIFGGTKSGSTYRLMWNSFSFQELETLFVKHGFHIVDMRGNMPLIAWLDNRIFNSDSFLAKAMVQLERVLGNISPFNHLGYYYLIEALKIT